MATDPKRLSTSGPRWRAAILVFFFALAAISQGQGVADDGAPFGRIDEADIERLYQFATTKGVDLKAELAKVYSSDAKLDEDALGRVFAFSRQFETLDANARAYGQMIYSSLLNIGEAISVDGYVKILERQPADVQQRIRDFLFYPYARHVSEAHWEDAMEETRGVYPTLFPKGFRFGHQDPVFGK